MASSRELIVKISNESLKQGRPKDEKEAVEWFIRAAVLGQNYKHVWA